MHEVRRMVATLREIFMNRLFSKTFGFWINICTCLAVDKTRIRPDRIGMDRTDKTWIGSDQTHKTWIGSNSIKQTHIYSLKVGAFQIPIKKMVKWYLWIKMTKRDQESDCHCTVFAFSSAFCREDFLFIVTVLHSVNCFITSTTALWRGNFNSVCQSMYN